MTGARETTQPSERDLGSGSDPATPDESRQADAEHMSQLARARRARVAKTLLALVIIVGLIVFVLENAGPVPIRFLIVTVHPRLLWVLAGCALLGGIAGYLVGRPRKRTRLHQDESDGERPSHA